MDNTMTWWEAHRPSKRKLIQLYSALLYNAHLRGFIDGEIYQGKAKAGAPLYNTSPETARRRILIRRVLLVAAVIFVVLGVQNGSMKDVLVKAIRICTECVGLG